MAWSLGSNGVVLSKLFEAVVEIGFCQEAWHNFEVKISSCGGLVVEDTRAKSSSNQYSSHDSNPAQTI